MTTLINPKGHLMNKIITSTKAVWHRNKGKLAVAGVITTFAVFKLHQISLNQHNDFLKEKGLYEEFYTLDEV